jgi:hypothetical protein
MSNHGNHDKARVSASWLSKRARLQALLFAAGSIGTTLLTLGLLAEVKIPRSQSE